MVNLVLFDFPHFYQSSLNISTNTPAVRKRRGTRRKHHIDVADFTGIATPEPATDQHVEEVEEEVDENIAEEPNKENEEKQMVK